MNPKLMTQGRRILSKSLPDSDKLRYLAYLPKLERFRKNHTEDYPTFENHHKMYDYLNKTVMKNGSILYLEFGVFKGASIKYWAGINNHIESRFYGFDTFTGLPEQWDTFTGRMGKKVFDVGGRHPQVDDKRVFFIKGMFQDTLPQFLESCDRNQQIVMHNDADLYSSTLYVLTCANSIISPGSIIIFDEFSCILHEFRALEDYCAAYIREFQVIGATISPSSYYDQVAIRIK